MKNRKLRKSHDCERSAKIVPGRFWHLPSIFAELQVGAQDGLFSASLLVSETQFPVLLAMLGVVLFKYIKLPGISLRRAQFRVVEMDGEVIGHMFLIWQGGGVEVSTCVINKNHRRCGLGQALLEDAVNIAEDQPVNAYCLPKAHAMRMLLRRHGFMAKDPLLLGPEPNVVLQHWQFLPDPSKPPLRVGSSA